MNRVNVGSCDRGHADLPLPSTHARFRLERRARLVKQSVVCALSGLSQSVLSRWESGGLELPEATVVKLWSALEMAPPDERGLRHLISGARLPVHLVTERRHQLLAASAPRKREWGGSASRLLGASLWRFASPEIRAAEHALGAAGWWQARLPEPIEVGLSTFDAGLRIMPGTMRWERLYLSDGTPVRLCTSHSRRVNE